jgi:predicted unusual protein kinase regulating ubiquinone biosynthesis (AarF/ABC1/UbiB family)
MLKFGKQRQVPLVLPTAPTPMSRDASSQRFRWQRAKYSPLARQFDIFTAATSLGLAVSRDLLLPTTNERYHRRQAQKLVNTLIGLGPTFIKIGQSLSTRVDFLHPSYIEALGQLQDRVPAFSSTEAIAIIESELGGSIASLFIQFDPIPIAAASLGQVHKARLRSSGETVVIKVQRQGLQRLFELDFKIIDRLLWWSEKLLPWTRKYNIRDIYQEFFTLLFLEIDYTHEGQNADRFRANFKANKLVIAPYIYWRYTTRKVLTMSYLPGIKIDDRAALVACGFKPSQINQIGICCYLKQLLIDGFFQADPHPGNMAITAEGKLVVYDFGMMAELKSLAKGQMIETFWAVMKKDGDAVTDRLIDLGLIVPGEDMKPIKNVIEFLLERFTDRPIDVREFNQIKTELVELFTIQPFRLTPEMTFILKALATLDGIARTLDPEYNLVLAAQPFIQSVAIAERGNIISQFGKQASAYLKYKLQQPNHTQLLIQRLEQRLERGEVANSKRSELTEKSIQRLYSSIQNLNYLCLTGFSAIAGILLLSTYPSLSLVLWVITAGAAFIWLKSSIRGIGNRG